MGVQLGVPCSSNYHIILFKKYTYTYKYIHTYIDMHLFVSIDIFKES